MTKAFCRRSTTALIVITVVTYCLLSQFRFRFREAKVHHPSGLMTATFQHQSDRLVSSKRNNLSNAFVLYDFMSGIKLNHPQGETKAPSSVPGTNQTPDQPLLLPLLDPSLTFNASLETSATTVVGTRQQPYRKWAYAFLIGGCNPQDGQYRGILYGSIVSAWMLQRHGTKADIVFLIQMSSKTNDLTLPVKEENLLRAMNITTRYVPKFQHPNMEIFYSIIMEKFRILDMIEYSRVFFLDADIMPLCSFDYLLELSEPARDDNTNDDNNNRDDDDHDDHGGNNNNDTNKDRRGHGNQLKGNVILAWNAVPAIAGSFIVRPGPGEYQTIQDIIVQTESKALQLPFPHWDKVEGWGHNFSSTDYWRSFTEPMGMLWNFYGADADQGLLLYWTKYYKQSVSIIYKNQVEQWEGHNGTVTLEEKWNNRLSEFSCNSNSKRGGGWAPYRDFVHFTGKKRDVR